MGMESPMENEWRLRMEGTCRVDIGEEWQACAK